VKTSGGKMIAPLPIEEKLKEAPVISQVCVVGDGRKYLSALITLSESKLNELKGNGALSGKVVNAPEVVSEVRKYVDQLNGELASYEQIKRFAVLSKEFSIVDGEMTPTLKMKRGVIERRYQDVIDSLYG
jgi:long-chain acyl-CoA synthetase